MKASLVFALESQKNVWLILVQRACLWKKMHYYLSLSTIYSQHDQVPMLSAPPRWQMFVIIYICNPWRHYSLFLHSYLARDRGEQTTGQKCQKCFKNVKNVLKMSKMFQKCQKCFKNVKNVSKMSKNFKNVKNVSKMSKMFQKCQKCFKKVNILKFCDNIWNHHYECIQINPNMLSIGSITCEIALKLRINWGKIIPMTGKC